MKASIVIATRNREPQLNLALASIKNKGYKDIEIVVVDDASTDGTQEMLSKYPTLINHRINRNGGIRNPSEVLNYGHSLAQSEIIIEQNGEVCHLTDCITPLLNICRPGLATFAKVHNGTVEDMEYLTDAIKNGKYEFPVDYYPEYKSIFETQIYFQCAASINVNDREIQLYCGVERPVPFFFLGAIHKEDFQLVNGYNPNTSTYAAGYFGNDTDFADRLLQKGIQFCFVGKAIAIHLCHNKT